jgi:hypothetical protein
MKVDDMSRQLTAPAAKLSALMNNLNQKISSSGGNEASVMQHGNRVLKLGLDMHDRQVTVAMQEDGGRIKPSTKCWGGVQKTTRPGRDDRWLLTLMKPHTRRPGVKTLLSSLTGRTSLFALFPALRTGLLSWSPFLLRLAVHFRMALPPGYGGTSRDSSTSLTHHDRQSRNRVSRPRQIEPAAVPI